MNKSLVLLGPSEDVGAGWWQEGLATPPRGLCQVGKEEGVGCYGLAGAFCLTLKAMSGSPICPRKLLQTVPLHSRPAWDRPCSLSYSDPLHNLPTLWFSSSGTRLGSNICDWHAQISPSVQPAGSLSLFLLV